MSDAINKLHDYLAKSPSVVYPEDVLAYLPAIEAENVALRELMSVMAYCIQGWRGCDGCRVNGGAGIITERAGCYVLLDRLRELGFEVTE